MIIITEDRDKKGRFLEEKMCFEVPVDTGRDVSGFSYYSTGMEPLVIRNGIK